MKRYILLVTVLIILVVLVISCTKNSADAIKFKDEYESLNGEVNSSGKEHRTVSISSNNPFVYITAKELTQKINNNETFYVYFGSKSCPWCRSVIEKAIEVATEQGIDTIYYVDIWDDDGNEILRDTYTIEDGELVLKTEGTDEYYELLELLDNVLDDYILTDSDGNEYDTGEKRIYAPNFVYIENGEALKLVEGTSPSQTDSREELTDEILQDEEDIFTEFFDN